MDLRLEVFDLLYRDALLRALLLRHADRLERAPAADGRCFLALRWSGVDPPRSSADVQRLTARAHLPREAPDRGYLDTVVRRLDAVLVGGGASASIAVRRRARSRAVADADGTVVAECVFDVVAAPPQRTAAVLLELPSWLAGSGACVPAVTPSGAAPSLN